MRQALEGFPPTRPLPAEYRDWEIVRLTGWTLDQIDATPGHFLDWIRQFGIVEADLRRG